MDFRRDILPHILIIIAFAVISYVYFTPAIEGKVLLQHDVIQYSGMAQEAREHMEETGEHTNWTNSMFGGMPIYQIMPHYPNRLFLLEYGYDLIVRLFPRPVSFLFTYFIGFYILLLCFGVNKWVAVAGAMAFGLSSYNIIIIEAGHNTKAIAIGLAPIVLGALYFTYMNNKRYLFTGVAFTSLFLAYQLRANHLQITYYLFMLILIFLIVEIIKVIRDKEYKIFIKTSLMLALGALLAISSGITNLLMTYEYGQDTIRGPSELKVEKEREGRASSGLDKAYALGWSYGIAETGTLIIPNFAGGSSQERYWGKQPFVQGPTYLGASVCFLFILGFFLINGRLKWWLLAGTILSIMLAWGKNLEWFTDMFFYNFPFYNRFRAVSMILVIASFTVPLLGMYALNKFVFFKNKKEELIKALKYATIITAGFCLLFFIFPGMWFDYIGENDVRMLQQYEPAQQSQVQQILIDDRIEMMKDDAGRSLIFILITAAALLFFTFGKINRYVTLIVIGGVITIDLWGVAKRYLDDSKFVTKRQFENPVPLTEADRFILEDTDPNYKVLKLTSDVIRDATTSYYHKSIGGYHGAKLRRYQDLYDHLLGNQIQNLRNTGLENAHLLHMLNTKYFITSDSREGVFQNPYALGNAWFVQNLILAENATHEMEILSKIDPSKDVVVDKRFEDYINQKIFSYEAGAEIVLTEYQPDHIKYISKAPSTQMAVFSEIYYNNKKGWKVYVNGERQEHIRVNYVLRAMYVPEGENTIEFIFEPDTYYLGEQISLIASLMLLIFILSAIVYDFKLYEYFTSKNKNVSN